MKNIFKIRRDERLFASVAALIAIAFNILLATYHFSMLSRCGKVGYWTIFRKYFEISGFDPYSYLTLSQWKVYYTEFRHPILSFVLYPLTLLNRWLMDVAGINCSFIILGAFMAFFATYSAIFLRRILQDIVGLRGNDSTLLTLLFFSFAYVMLVVCVADHFGMSLFLLLMTLYIAGRHQKDHTPMPWWQTAVLFFITAGVTLSNGAKTLMASLFTSGREFFRPKHLLLAVVVPMLLVAGAAAWQYESFLIPQRIQGAKLVEQKIKKDAKFAKEQQKLQQRHQRLNGTQISSDGVLSWINLSVSRTDALIENIFGEGIMLHKDHLLQDIFRERPVIVRYRTPVPYIIGGALFLLLVAGLWTSRHEPFMQMVAAWVAFDAFIHLVLGFGLNEPYIMTAHWAFIIPLAIGWLIKKSKSERFVAALRTVVWTVAIFLSVYNATLIFTYLSD